jgi:peptidoglycan/xylan/chitin deacetylase (PgdA/CDA1 family)
MRARLIAAVAAALALTGCTSLQRPSTPATPSGPFKLAITIDDLPVHGGIPNDMTALQINRQMVEAIKAARIPAMGFVNGQWVEKDPGNLAALEVWRAAGIPLANHSWAHLNFNDLSVDAYKQEIVRNEPLLDKIDPAGGKRWFRFPFLAEGEDAAKRAQIRRFLADRGYKIAGVTMDFSDWQFNSTYTRCRNVGDQRAIRRMEDMYLQAARDHVHHSRRLSHGIYGREIPQVQLMHVGALSARLMPRLIDLYRSMGAQFVTLAEAQADAAYAEDNDLRLPARSQFINARAQALGLKLAHPKDNEAELAAMCSGANR